MTDTTFRCIDHSMHRAAYHFIKALGIPSSMVSKRKLTKTHEDDGNIDKDETEEVEVEEDEADIDVSMDIDASADDADAMMGTTITSYDPGDTLGKLLAFVNQVRMSSEGVHEYLTRACVLQSIDPIELRLWVRSRWGSLSHCLESTLGVQKVSLSYTFLNCLLYYIMSGN